MVMVVPLWMHYPSQLRECEVTLLYIKGHKKEDTAPTLLRGSDFIHLFIGDDYDLFSTEPLPDKEQGSHGLTVWAWTQHQERVLVLSDQKVAICSVPAQIQKRVRLAAPWHNPTISDSTCHVTRSGLN